jgi:hypothetical protein
VPFTEPFLSTNGSSNRLNGLSSLQVVEGPGDATQGNIGSGLVNVIPKRGTYPPSGLLDFEMAGPNFDHQFGLEFGVATKSGNISNYLSYIGDRSVPYYGYHNSDFASNNAYFGDSLLYNDDFLDNFVFKFGHNNNQSLSVLYDTRDLQGYGEAGGLTGRIDYLYDPYTINNGGFGFNPFSGLTATAAGDAALFSQYTGVLPYTSATNANQITKSQLTSFVPTQLLKFEYDNNLDDKTFFQARYYNFISTNGTNSAYDSATNPSYSVTGGQRVGTNFELTRTFGQHTLTLQGQFENQKPLWNDYAPLETEDVLLIGQGGVSLNDFLPASINPAGSDGWVYSHLGFTRLPTVGINYNGTNFQTEGIGLRDQWNPSDKLKLDYGFRVDHANYKYGPNPYNPDLSNPSDVDPSFITDKVLHPTVLEPRIAISFQPTKNDAIRASYGRSVEFLNAQDAGTPAGLYGANALMNVPVLPGTNTSNPATWTCGSGLNSARLLPSGANASGKGGGYFQCTNYAQQLFWSYDQNFDAPDLGNGTSPTYNNYDLSYQHQFKNGFGMKATGFYRLSSGLPGFFVLAQSTDPVTGQILYQVFSVNNNAIQKTTGLEMQLTTPEKRVGFSGFRERDVSKRDLVGSALAAGRRSVAAGHLAVVPTRRHVSRGLPLAVRARFRRNVSHQRRLSHHARRAVQCGLSDRCRQPRRLQRIHQREALQRAADQPRRRAADRRRLRRRDGSADGDELRRSGLSRQHPQSQHRRVARRERDLGCGRRAHQSLVHREFDRRVYDRKTQHGRIPSEQHLRSGLRGHDAAGQHVLSARHDGRCGSANGPSLPSQSGSDVVRQSRLREHSE